MDQVVEHLFHIPHKLVLETELGATGDAGKDNRQKTKHA
jgi:hypothetical protein